MNETHIKGEIWVYGFRVKGTRRGTKRGKETGAMFQMRPHEGGGGRTIWVIMCL